MNILDNPKLQRLENEIRFFNEQGIRVTIEVGKRLEEAKSEFATSEEWVAWSGEQFGYKKSQVYKLVAIAKRFHSSGNYLEGKTINEVYALAAFDDEELHTPVQLSTGEIKKPIDMSAAEIDRLKRDIAEAERRAAQAEATATAERNRANHAEKLWQQAKNQPPRVETKTVEIVPRDYEELKRQAAEFQRLNTEHVKLQRDMTSQREQYEEKLSAQQKRDSAKRDLQKFLAEHLRALSMNHDSAIFNYTLIQGDAEAYNMVTRFLEQYEAIIKKQFAEWEQLTTLRAVN